MKRLKEAMLLLVANMGRCRPNGLTIHWQVIGLVTANATSVVIFY